VTVTESLASFFEPWADLYGNSALISTLVVFTHIAALVFAGGLAVTLDRATLRASRGPAEFRWRQLEELASAHRLVVIGVTLSVVSGLLLLTADIATYLTSPIYWIKMSLFALLLVNGWAMTRLETRIRHAPNAADAEGWRLLRRTALFSIVLWFAIAFSGVALVNA
jgi:hypothetical protein